MNTYLQTKTKIVGTLGPNSSSIETISKMLENGLSVARINMSHGDHETHAKTIRTARQAAKKVGRPLAILQDLAGPKIRIGDFETEEVTLLPGKELILTTQKCVGTVDRVHVNYKKLPQEVKEDTILFLNDGKQKLRVKKVTKTEIHTVICIGGTIRGRRGVNVPDGNLSVSSLTAKDVKDLKFGLSQDVDFITLSFVRTADDIIRLRKLIGNTKDVAIVAKIETKSAIDNLEAIVDAADAIMVARGDLAIETPLEKVPLLQKRIIKIANYAGKPVITATQMLDSMRIATTPTRAEVADIANAILDGTDAIMLSDETAVGNHPERAVEVMLQVAHEIEQDAFFIDHQKDWSFATLTICDAVTRSIARSVKPTQAKVIAALSESGHTARMIARHRPHAPILVLTPKQSTFNKMLLVYGCEPVIIKNVKGMTSARKVARRIIASRGLAKVGETFILGAGIPFGKSGSTNTMLIEHL
ncbi:MAG: pyruvate kinase [Candidatus Kaiserbacteria bacterium]|nr:pyruvate kinase [Candidatus Kaiserbacteria bacterium]MCB9816115.1 pyruvate kinase [Candidatus Nomurabacteria bacterium]